MTIRRVPGWLALAGSLIAGGAVAAPAPQWLHDPALTEISGLAESRRSVDHFWTLNDSGNSAELLAINRRGQRTARVVVDGVVNVDWEDLAAYDGPDGPMLAIADCGDNFKRRRSIRLILLPEPDPLQDGRVSPLQVRELRYPDGARDCESLVVEPGSRRFLLIDKGEARVGMYAAEERQTGLVKVAELQHRHPDRPPPVLPISGRYRGAISAADLSADGRQLLALTYTHWLLYTRRPEESWATALARVPLSQRLPAIRGLEAIAWDRNGGIWVSGEGQPAPLLHWPRPALGWARPAPPAAVPSAPSGSGSTPPVQ